MHRIDPAPLYTAAARMSDLSDLVRIRARRIAQQRAGLRWHSPAAVIFDDSAAGLTAQLTDCADRLDAFADRIRRFAVQVTTAPR